MGGGMDGFELADGHVGVDLGGGEEGVAQHLLNEAEVGSVFQHEGGAGVAEEVATPNRSQARAPDVLADQGAQAVDGKGLAAAAHKEGAVVRSRQQVGAAVGAVAFKPGQGPVADGNQAAASAFAVTDVERPLDGLEVAPVEEGQFGAADAGGIEGFQDGPVAQAQNRGDIGLGQNQFGFGGGEDMGGQGPGLAREVQIGCRIGRQVALPGEPAEERLDGIEIAHLGAPTEGTARGLLKLEEPALKAVQHGAGDLARLGQAAFGAPGDKGGEAAAAGGDGAGGEVAGFQRLKEGGAQGPEPGGVALVGSQNVRGGRGEFGIMAAHQQSPPWCDRTGAVRPISAFFNRFRLK